MVQVFEVAETVGAFDDHELDDGRKGMSLEMSLAVR